MGLCVAELLKNLMIVIIWVQLCETADKQEVYVIFDGEDYIITSEPKDDWVAKGIFQNQAEETGWSSLEIQTNQLYLDRTQAQAAGMAEGFLTHQLISDYYYNTMDDFCQDKNETCALIKDYISKNMKWLEFMTASDQESYWHQVNLAMNQLKGLEIGYEHAANETFPIDNFIWMNMFGDIEDLESVFNPNVTVYKSGRIVGSGSCSALIKLLPGNEDLLVSHVTWNGYQSMTRIMKKYVLGFRTTSKRIDPIIPGFMMSFSSYPGVIFSGDDFTLISSGLVTLETTIGNSNPDLWKHVKPVGQMMEWLRCIVANRLATSGKEWVSIFRRFNSGTYNNQWMVVDYDMFQPLKNLSSGVLWVLEQIPGYTESRDMTWLLYNQTYWPSYNTPYFKTVFTKSGLPKMVEKYGNWFSYENTPRALIFKRDNHKVKDLSSMIKLMRYNNYTLDPLSACNCTPPFSAENAISARCDLNPINGTYPFAALGHRSHGSTDVKVTSSELFENLNFIAIAGPTYDPLPPFQWSKVDFVNTTRHRGQPDLWKFEAVQTNWTVHTLSFLFS